MLIQKRSKILLIILDVTFLEFLDQISLLKLFLNCEKSCEFSDPFRSEYRQCCITKLIGLALSCIESAAVLKRRTDVWLDKDRELLLLQLCVLRIVNGRMHHV